MRHRGGKRHGGFKRHGGRHRTKKKSFYTVSRGGIRL